MKIREMFDTNGFKIFINENNQYHRENGPAVIYNEKDFTFYINDLLHREDGPAVVRGDNKYFSWFIMDENIK